LTDRVVFEGRGDNLKPYYIVCDVLVLPSSSPLEAFGLVQLEAMIFGKPVVTSDLPTGVTYVNLGGKTGLTYPVGDSDKLADALGRLISDEQFRKDLGRFARDRVRKEFLSSVSGETFARKLLSLCGKPDFP
jgi:rhamnosyl/mannosyltransferase